MGCTIFHRPNGRSIQFIEHYQIRRSRCQTNNHMEEQTLSTSKQAILDAAQALLARHGYAGLSMRELALESGLAKATIYHYFQDKEEIFRQVLERDMLTVHEHLQRAMAAESGSLAKLGAVVNTLFSLLHARRTIMMSVLRELGENKQVFHEVICAHRDTHLRLLMGLIQAGIDEGVFRPVNVEYTTYSLLGMINTFVFFRLYLTDADIHQTNSDADAAEHTLRLLLEGLQRPAPAIVSP